jgi:prolyl 4-hydroxylase
MHTPVIIEDFIPSDDCDYLINTYKDKLERSYIVNNATGKLEYESTRTSSSYYIPNSDSVVKSIKKKVSEFLSIPEENIEGLQLLRYLKGERFLYHHDYFKTPGITNQRVHTVLLYLNTLEESEGGATSFYHHKMKVYPKKGRAVWFRNMDENGNLLDTSLHAGEEILTGSEKYAINVWTRQHKF